MKFCLRTFTIQSLSIASLTLTNVVILSIMSVTHFYINSLSPRPNRRHFADDIFRCIFENENELISSRISLKLVPKVRINNSPALVQIMAWRRPGDKPLSEPMMVSLVTHICVTRPQWVNHVFVVPIRSKSVTGFIGYIFTAIYITK